MGNVKKLIPCIFLKNERAVKNFNNDSLISADPVKLSLEYYEAGADEIIVYDLSSDDDAHEKALSIISEICRTTQIPIIGAGNVNSTDDVFMLLEAGCAKAALNYSKPNNIEITKEVSLKFGKDKIVACIKEALEISANEDILLDYVSEVILIDEHTIRQAKDISKLPVIITVPEISLDKILEIFKSDIVIGMTGTAINDNKEEFESIKKLCIENNINVNTVTPKISWDSLKKNSDGMVPVIVQDYKTNQVLMCAYMNEEAYLNTLKSGLMTYYSRSRQELWLKGDTSGHYQYVKELTADCDLDTILAKVEQVGAACHTGSYSCFFNEIIKNDYDSSNPLSVFEDILEVIKDRKSNPQKDSYTNYLFDNGLDKILKKLGEEATEIVIAAKNPNTDDTKSEIADFMYHMMVLMVEKDISWNEIIEELYKR